MSLIDIKNLSFAYDGSAEKVFDNVSFQIDTGWRLGFTGREEGIAAIATALLVSP